MSARKVKIYIRIRSAGKHVYAEPVWNRNRTLREGYALVGEKIEHHAEGVYYLRYARGGTRGWESVGNNADVALVAQRNAEHDLQAFALGRAIPVPVEPTVAKRLIETTIVDYLDEIRRFRAPKTISACENILARFASRNVNKAIDELTRKDLLDHMVFLKGGGLGDRSVFNHIARITTLLKGEGIGGLLRKQDWPKYDEKEVTAYSSEQLTSFFAAADEDARELFQFFLGTGFREQEVQYSTWANVDFDGKVVSVWSKPELGFRVKDKEERSVPVPDSLIEMLQARKERSTSTLIFPSRSGKPNGHFLRRLQAIASEAGLNCGECFVKNGGDCGSKPACSAWGLHKFRKTFATMHAEAGVSAPTIQRWLGHSDLTTTLRYLAISDMRSERTRSQVNAAFAKVALLSFS